VERPPWAYPIDQGSANVNGEWGPWGFTMVSYGTFYLTISDAAGHSAHVVVTYDRTTIFAPP